MKTSACPLCGIGHSDGLLRQTVMVCVDCSELPSLERFEKAAENVDRVVGSAFLDSRLIDPNCFVLVWAAREILRDRDRSDARRARTQGLDLGRAREDGERAGLRRAAWVVREAADRVRSSRLLLLAPQAHTFLVGLLLGVADDLAAIGKGVR